MRRIKEALGATVALQEVPGWLARHADHLHASESKGLLAANADNWQWHRLNGWEDCLGCGAPTIEPPEDRARNGSADEPCQRCGYVRSLIEWYLGEPDKSYQENGWARRVLTDNLGIPHYSSGQVYGHHFIHDDRCASHPVKNGACKWCFRGVGWGDEADRPNANGGVP